MFNKPNVHQREDWPSVTIRSFVFSFDLRGGFQTLPDPVSDSTECNICCEIHTRKQCRGMSTNIVEPLLRHVSPLGTSWVTLPRPNCDSLPSKIYKMQQRKLMNPSAHNICARFVVTITCSIFHMCMLGILHTATWESVLSCCCNCRRSRDKFSLAADICWFDSESSSCRFNKDQLGVIMWNTKKSRTTCWTYKKGSGKGSKCTEKTC